MNVFAIPLFVCLFFNDRYGFLLFYVNSGHGKKLIAFQKSSEVVGGSNPVRANDAKSSSQKNTKGSEQPPTKSKSKATDDIDDKVMDFLAVSSFRNF
jgi:hypothetical protein